MRETLVRRLAAKRQETSERQQQTSQQQEENKTNRPTSLPTAVYLQLSLLPSLTLLLSLLSLPPRPVIEVQPPRSHRISTRKAKKQKPFSVCKRVRGGRSLTRLHDHHTYSTQYRYPALDVPFFLFPSRLYTLFRPGAHVCDILFTGRVRDRRHEKRGESDFLMHSLTRFSQPLLSFSHSLIPDSLPDAPEPLFTLSLCIIRFSLLFSSSFRSLIHDREIV